MVRVAVIGFGSRGQMFGRLIHDDPSVELVAVADTEKACREAGLALGLKEDMLFESAEAFWAKGKICDAVFICTQDAQHIGMALKAMELGYDICLEKPAAVNIEDCIRIRDTANRLGRKVMLTHVLRYAPFYQQIKKWIDAGTLGEIVTINQTENIAYWHFALSYVRGPWRKMSDSSPTIIAKCCHDLDMLNWLIPSKCTSVSSYGNLFYFNRDHAPEGSADYCVDCDPKVKEKCLYNAYHIYPQRMGTSVVGGTARIQEKNIYEILDGREDIIGRCVFLGENDAIDNQVVNLSFESGATAHLTMCAFSERCYRYIKVHGTKGEVYGDADEGILYLAEFGKPLQTIDVNKTTDHMLDDGHGGGDYFLYRDFIDYITVNSPSFTRTTIDDSIESHLIGFQAEESRLLGGTPKVIEEDTKMAKKTLGMSLDCSRNGVMKPEKVKEFAKMISDMGYNMLQLYTEDTYEIEGEPFFGHMRGRYSREELKDIDAYCQSVGVELVPCIQVLAHLNQLVQWEVYAPLFDCNDILMVGDEKVYELIEKMFVTIEECFTSRRVNIGMDEAMFVGRGRYQDKHGYRDRVAILTEHLSRVVEIGKKHGFHIMMWSDMFIRLHNGGEYYGENIRIPQETIDRVPEGVELIFWDYSHTRKEVYDSMMKTHEEFHNPIAFAGGLWTWTGYAPNSRFGLEAVEASMRCIQEHPVDTVFFTVWGDCGKDCSYYAVLPLIFAAAKMAQGNFDRKEIAKQFEEQYGYTFDEFMNLELPNITNDGPGDIANPNKILLFNDPFLGIYDFTVHSEMAKRYEAAEKKLEESMNGREYDYLFDVEKKLVAVLKRKCDLGVQLRKAYQSKDTATLSAILEQDFAAIKQDLKAFYEAFRFMWLKENKPFGLEVQEQRFGGLLYRMETCENRLRAYLNGEVNKLDELEEQILVKCHEVPGEGIVQQRWDKIMTANIG